METLWCLPDHHHNGNPGPKQVGHTGDRWKGPQEGIGLRLEMKYDDHTSNAYDLDVMSLTI